MNDMLSHRYRGLKFPREFAEAWEETPDEMCRICNGVGSPTSWTYHLTPDTIWGLDITPVSDIHDWVYSYPLCMPWVVTDPDVGVIEFNSGEDYRKYGDTMFFNNLITIINNRGSWWLRFPRKIRAKTYYHVLRDMGEESFWHGKKREITDISKEDVVYYKNGKQ